MLFCFGRLWRKRNGARQMPEWTSPQLGGLTHLQYSHRENSPMLSGLPGPADRATRLGGVPHFSCERDQEQKKDCMERLVTPLRQGTSPSRGPPPSCEQTLTPIPPSRYFAQVRILVPKISRFGIVRSNWSSAICCLFFIPLCTCRLQNMIYVPHKPF